MCSQIVQASQGVADPGSNGSTPVCGASSPNTNPSATNSTAHSDALQSPPTALSGVQNALHTQPTLNSPSQATQPNHGSAGGQSAQSAGINDGAPLTSQTQTTAEHATIAQTVATQSPQTATCPGSAASASLPASNTPHQAATSHDNSNSSAQPSANQTSTNTTTNEWISKWLRSGSLYGLASTSLCFAITLGVLLGLSISFDGFVEVVGTNIVYLGYQFGPGLAYTSLPVLISNLYVFWFAAVIAACVVREPFIELFDRGRTKSAASAHRSFFLEYSQIPVLNILDAFKEKQAFLLAGFILLGVIQFLLPSLVAHLFDNAVVSVKLSKAAVYASAFEPSGFGSTSDLVPAIETAVLLKVYGGYQLPWTSSHYSFQNFSLLEPPNPLMNTNFTIKTAAYYGKANCKYLPVGRGKAQVLSGSSPITNIRIHDRGCTYTISVGSYTPQHGAFSGYVEVFNTASCPVAGGESRLAVFSAKAPANKKGELIQASIISCIPSYFKESGYLTVNYDSIGQKRPKIQTFQPINGSKEKLLFEKARFRLAFESQLSQASVFDTAGGFRGSDFGLAILRFARKLDPKSPFQYTTILRATSEMFEAVFAHMASQSMFVSQASSASNDYRSISMLGDLYINQQRLHVVEPVAIGTMAILVLAGLYLIWIHKYVAQHKSILLENPAGIMGSTIFMTKNEFATKYLDKQLTSTKDGKFWENTKKDPRISGKGFKLVNGNAVQDRCIKETSDVRELSWKDAFMPNNK